MLFNLHFSFWCGSFWAWQIVCLLFQMTFDYVFHRTYAWDTGDCYIYRGDTVQVDTWVSASGKNGMRRDWLVYDCKTGDTLTRASRYFPSPFRWKMLSFFVTPIVIFIHPWIIKLTSFGFAYDWIILVTNDRGVYKLKVLLCVFHRESKRIWVN